MSDITITLDGKEIINFDDFSYTNDFFNPIDTWSFQLKGQDVQQVSKIANNASVEIKCKGSILLRGYLDTKSTTISRSGTTCNLSGRNKLGWVADSTMFPNIKDNFKTGMTYQEVFNAIFGPFDMPTFVSENNTTSQTALKKLLRNQLKTKQVLNRNEGCLELAMRFAKRSGWFIKLDYPFASSNISANENSTVLLITPNYDNNLFAITKNDVLNLNMKIDTQDQPTILISNGRCYDGYGFKATATTSAFVNEITGFDYFMDYNHELQGFPQVAVQNYIEKYNLQKAIGSKDPSKVVFNKPLANAIFNFVNKNNNPIVRPYYSFDDNSISAEEIYTSGKMKLHEFQRKFFNCDVSVQGFFNKNYIWQNNAMVKLTNVNELIDNSNLWISKVKFTYNRSSGSLTNLTLNLPGIYSDV